MVLALSPWEPIALLFLWTQHLTNLRNSLPQDLVMTSEMPWKEDWINWYRKYVYITSYEVMIHNLPVLEEASFLQMQRIYQDTRQTLGVLDASGDSLWNIKSWSRWVPGLIQPVLVMFLYTLMIVFFGYKIHTLPLDVSGLEPDMVFSKHNLPYLFSKYCPGLDSLYLSLDLLSILLSLHWEKQQRQYQDVSSL